MFNLIVGFTQGAADAARMLEHTSSPVQAWVKPGGVLDHSRLLGLPTLVMPETGGDPAGDFARIGRLEGIHLVGREYRYNFVPTPDVLPIPTDHVVAVGASLGITDWEFSRTHWAVKEHDLYGALLPYLVPPVAPRVFTLPTTTPTESDLVAVMMPFDAGFSPVYAALGEAAEAAGMHVQRADDIWVNDHIMADIIDLIWRARVVVSDLSGRNANVFYETGIAHTLGRDVIQITRAPADVPFDLQPLRYVHYLPNEQGLEALQASVTARLRALIARAT